MKYLVFSFQTSPIIAAADTKIKYETETTHIVRDTSNFRRIVSLLSPHVENTKQLIAHALVESPFKSVCKVSFKVISSCKLSM